MCVGHCCHQHYIKEVSCLKKFGPSEDFTDLGFSFDFYSFCETQPGDELLRNMERFLVLSFRFVRFKFNVFCLPVLRCQYYQARVHSLGFRLLV